MATPAARPPSARRTVEAVCLFLVALLLFRTVGAEPYSVPTGSMAPALFGHHQALDCPDCGHPIRVGHREDRRGPAVATCPNCGCEELRLDTVPVSRGDQVLVNKGVFDWRAPRRWEMAVFRCPAEEGKVFVKRVAGLPGEAVLLAGGDLYIDHELARKTLAECRAVRIPVFDAAYVPRRDGWWSRWEPHPARADAAVEGAELRLNGRDSVAWLVYRHGGAADLNGRTLTDEHSYNGRDGGRAPEPIHDFFLECEAEAVGDGWAAFGITDGQDRLLVEIPVGSRKGGTRLTSCPNEEATVGRPPEPWPVAEDARLLRNVPDLALAPGKTHRVELAFFDRRLALAVDGRLAFLPVNLPPAGGRADVARPVRFGARGCELQVRSCRLFRDLHYTAAGRHGSTSPVRLGAEEYFVLGDNSPNSDDSRFWSDAAGRHLPVRRADFLGKPFAVHLPSRPVQGEAFGRRWDYQALDWGRVRWLR